MRSIKYCRYRNIMAMVSGYVAVLLSVAACGEQQTEDLSKQDGWWNKEIAGLKLGQTCKSAHHHFGGKWRPRYVPDSPLDQNPSGEYGNGAEHVAFECVDSRSGSRVSSIKYSPGILLNADQFVDAVKEKLGPPQGDWTAGPRNPMESVHSRAPGERVLVWGDAPLTDVEDTLSDQGRSTHKYFRQKYAVVDIGVRGTLTDLQRESGLSDEPYKSISLEIGSDFAESESNARRAADEDHVKATNKPSL